jgi:hypothetical protein
MHEHMAWVGRKGWSDIQERERQANEKILNLPADCFATGTKGPELMPEVRHSMYGKWSEQQLHCDLLPIEQGKT